MRNTDQAHRSHGTPGDPIAVLRREPEDLGKALRLKFREGHDDLDRLRIARIRTANGRRFSLVRHLHAPQPGTEIVAAAASSDVWADITAVLERLNLTEKDLAWCHPAAKRNGVSTARRRTRALMNGGVLKAVASASGVSRKQVGSVFAALSAVAVAELQRRGTFTLPGMARVQVVKQAAKRAGKRAAKRGASKVKAVRKRLELRWFKTLKDALR